MTTTSNIDRLKSKLDFDLISHFDINNLKDNFYIPICELNGNIYVVATNDTHGIYVKDKIKEVLGKENLKYAKVDKIDFEEMIAYINSKIIPEYSQSENMYLQNNEVQLKYDTDESEDDIDSSEIDENETDNQSLEISTTKYLSKKIGEVVVDMGFATEDQIFNALIISKKERIPLGTILVRQNIITLDQLKMVLKAQFGIDVVDSSQLDISPEVLAVLPDDFIKMYKVIPISSDDRSLIVGMVNPNDKQAIANIIAYTGIKPKILIITHYEFSMCIQRYFNENAKSTNKIMRQMGRQSYAFERAETLYEQAQKELKDDTNIVVKFVNKMISDGIDMGASDIHIEPRLDGYIVRYRKDGILRKALDLPEKSELAILTRLKVISKMNIAEHRRPQDGSFSITYKEKDYDFRINTLPVGDAEKMVIRILAPAVSLSSQKEEMTIVGASKEDTDLIKKMESAPNGIILATGPTGSGKTTTLYTLLKAINDEKVNITTIEDPIEIRIDGINQSQINTKAGITFASCMRAILRQDPDVILVGEIRDIETLETAISAALTGHLVLSTLHTNSAASTITRMIDMGARDYLVSSTLVGIIAQRLVRRLCPHCRVEYFATREEAELVVAGGEAEIQKFMKTPIYKPHGCDKCGFEGYSGRLGVYEIMPITKEIKKLIAQGAHDIQIEEAAIGAGMNTLHQSCLKHIINGETTISEFLRVLGPVKE